ncbi:MAG TPA: SRPBCC family protein [Nitrospirota bacterium]|jgi:hypothetical protein
MVIEESVFIDAPAETVWETFVDLACWKDWSRIIEVEEGPPRLRQGDSFRFCIRPFAFPVNMEPVLVKVEPLRLVVWEAGKFGVRAHHEFLFETEGRGVRLVSVEKFTGLKAMLLIFRISRPRLEELTRMMLAEITKAAETASQRG